MRTIAAMLVGAVLLAACGSGDGEVGGGGAVSDLGPLAVTGPSNAVMEALTSGTIRITDECVYLEEAGGGETLLVWASNWTRWDPGDRAVLYKPFDNEVTRLRDGDQVSLGGGGFSAAEGDAPTFQWVNRPHPNCPTDSAWAVGEVVSAPN